MVDSRETERMSMLLSKHLENAFIGTKEELHVNRRAIVLKELFDQSQYRGGSIGEGFVLRGSDLDYMYTDSTVEVMYPNQFIPRNMASKTILYIREADCRPGYVHLQLGQRGQICPQFFLDSLVREGDSMFLSSDIYREKYVHMLSNGIGLKIESNGPSIKINIPGISGGDFVRCFPCYSWPKEAQEWRKRTRLHGWPCQTLIDNIVDMGVSLVPVGDKCSENTLLQWRISFAKAERSLVHSFTHTQSKVYVLLKYFLKQIKGTLADTIGDDDILCSYFLKTVMFHAIENTSQMFWQEKNMFYCFWFCFNILIDWVRVGYCPNYFIQTNNLFKRKVHGQYQIVLLDVLNNFYQMKWMCLSVGNCFDPIWGYLCDISYQAYLSNPKTVQEIVFGQDMAIVQSLRITDFGADRITMRKAIHELSTSQSGYDEVYTYHHLIGYLHQLATDQVYPEHMVATDNKTKYKSLRKCKRWIIPRASLGTELLYLATFHFLSGNFSKALGMCKQVTKLALWYMDYGPSCLPPQLLEEMYTYGYRHSGHILDRLRKIFTRTLHFYRRRLYLPHLCLEIETPTEYPPLPYAVFLAFLCCHELGDTRGRTPANTGPV